ncbi:hypothetical protein OQA88_2365 [Cercophora sp. LCS_1]
MNYKRSPPTSPTRSISSKFKDLYIKNKEPDTSDGPTENDNKQGECQGERKPATLAIIRWIIGSGAHADPKNRRRGNSRRKDAMQECVGGMQDGESSENVGSEVVTGGNTPDVSPA